MHYISPFNVSMMYHHVLAAIFTFFNPLFRPKQQQNMALVNINEYKFQVMVMNLIYSFHLINIFSCLSQAKRLVPESNQLYDLLLVWKRYRLSDELSDWFVL